MADPHKILHASDVRLRVRGADTNANLVVSDYDFEIDHPKDLVHSVGKRKPAGRLYGHVDFTFSLTLTGVNAEIAATAKEAGAVFDINIYHDGDSGHLLKDAANINYNESASEDGAVEVSAEFNAMDVEGFERV